MNVAGAFNLHSFNWWLFDLVADAHLEITKCVPCKNENSS